MDNYGTVDDPAWISPGFCVLMREKPGKEKRDGEVLSRTSMTESSRLELERFRITRR